MLKLLMFFLAAVCFLLAGFNVSARIGTLTFNFQNLGFFFITVGIWLVG